MVNGITWEELTHSRLLEAKKKQELAQTRADLALNEAKRWEEYIKTLEKALELDKLQVSVSLNERSTFISDQLLKQSTWDNLVAIMETNRGLLVVVDAVTLLVEAKVFNDREHARNVIYSTLYSHKKKLTKIRQGVYRLRDVSENINVIKKPKGTHGLKQAIIELKNVNPNITKEEVIKTLVERNFDFQGKSPGRTIHGAWINMKNTKKENNLGTQQALLVVPST